MEKEKAMKQSGQTETQTTLDLKDQTTLKVLYAAMTWLYDKNPIPKDSFNEIEDQKSEEITNELERLCGINDEKELRSFLEEKSRMDGEQSRATANLERFDRLMRRLHADD